MRKWIYHSLFVCFAVLFVNDGFSQMDSMMGVYAERLSPEKLHIHFDKSIYNKGETVWYKVYVLQHGDTASKNIYLEFYNANGKLITRTNAPLVFSTSQGSFDIPADYNGESLQVKAYTRWMLNDDPAFIYRRELAINSNDQKKINPPSQKTKLEIFPEGGHLITELYTRVAFKATNPYGNPVFIKGVLVDGNNQVLDSLNTAHDGMGSFYFMPVKGQNYQISWTDENGLAGKTPVPVTKTQGARITLQVKDKKARFQIQRTDSVPENFKKMNLLVHMNQALLYQVTIDASEKPMLNSEVAIHELPTGLLQFTLFTSDWIPIAERIIFINNGLHKFDAQVSAQLINFEKKGKNAIDISVPDTLLTNMSLSITDAALNLPEQHTIFSDVLLSSEIKGKIYNPAYYFADNTDRTATDLDLVMLTNGWRRFDWDKIKAHVAPKIEYRIETDYMRLVGKVPGVKKNSPPVALNLVVLGKDSSKHFLSVPVEKDGGFEYPFIFFDTAKIFFSVNNNKSLTEKGRLEMQNGLLQLPPKNIEPAANDPYLWNSSQAKQRLDVLLSEQELLRKKMSETTLAEVTVTTKVKTKIELLNEKYTSGFFTGNQAIRSYTFDLVNLDKPIIEPGILQYIQSKALGLNINCNSMLDCTVGWSRARGPIDLYVNEMSATLDLILGLTIDNIALVKAFAPPFMYSTKGMLGGALIIYTKKMDDYKEPELKGIPNLVLAGYTKFKEFYNPSYEVPDEKAMKPDHRTTLYWNPNLTTDPAQQHVRVEFFNNDFTKTFNVVLEGINAAGKMVRVERTFNSNMKVEK
jgi:hypothetical protein